MSLPIILCVLLYHYAFSFVESPRTGVEAFSWSPEGNRLAVLCVENDKDTVKVLGYHDKTSTGSYEWAELWSSAISGGPLAGVRWSPVLTSSIAAIPGGAAAGEESKVEAEDAETSAAVKFANDTVAAWESLLTYNLIVFDNKGNKKKVYQVRSSAENIARRETSSDVLNFWCSRNQVLWV